MSDAREPILQVIICTYNNADSLDDVLSALAAQTATAEPRWSCLVVDNNCTDHTGAVVQKHAVAGVIPGLRSVLEREQGLTPARLRGVRSSTAPWVAFVDDDCLLRSDWITQALSFLGSHPTVGAIGGRVILDWEIEPPAYMRAYGYAFAEQDHGDSQKVVPFLVGAGLVVSRSALMACHWTDGPLLADRVGRRLVSGGDVEIVLRIAGAGYQLWYVPECEILHRIPSMRSSLRYVIAINRGLGVSEALAGALVWEQSTGKWLAASWRTMAHAMKNLACLAVAVACRKRTPADILIQGSFRLGQIQGMSRVAWMSAADRRRLMGRARPVAKRADRPPTKAA